MRTTYTRVMTGSRVTASPIDQRWVYLMVAVLIASAGLLARIETITLSTSPAGIAASVAILMGFVARRIDVSDAKAEAPFDESSVAALDKVAELSVFANFADLTGGDVSANGRRVALATYGGWYELVLTSGAISPHGFDSIWDVKPALIGRGAVAQWEAIAYRQDSRAVLMTSEGSQTHIYGASN